MEYLYCNSTPLVCCRDIYDSKITKVQPHLVLSVAKIVSSEGLEEKGAEVKVCRHDGGSDINKKYTLRNLGYLGLN
jgi:hypothetical protein